MPIRKATTKKATIKRKPIIEKKVAPSKHSRKTIDEREELKCLISIGIRESKPVSKIMAELKESNYKISVATVYAYIREVRNDWKKTLTDNYETHVASQFAKLDLMEEKLWEMLHKSMNPEEVKTTSRQSGRVLTEDIKTTSSHGDVEIMKMIERIWVRRNEILGITSSTINIQNNIQNNIEQTNIENKVEVTKVEFQPVSDKFFGNFVIEVADRVKP